MKAKWMTSGLERRRSCAFGRLKTVIAVFLFCLACLVVSADAGTYPYADAGAVIGCPITYRVRGAESLIEIARKFDLGYNEITAANPGVDPFVPGDGRSVTMPMSWVLPDIGSHDGVVINLSEMRLYYFFKDRGENFVQTFPIGIGRQGFNTPVGVFRVTEKIVKPSWHVPDSIRNEKPELPRVVPPGPDNPLGSHALRTSGPDILIHGTNRPWGIGRRVSHGCIRLYPADIPKLFAKVSQGAPVVIVRQPVKAGTRDGRVFLEVHADQGGDPDYCGEAQRVLAKKGLLGRVNTRKLFRALEEKSGIPTDISD